MASKDEGEWVDEPTSGGEWVDETPTQAPPPGWDGTEDPEGFATRMAQEKYAEEAPGYMKSLATGAYQGATRKWGDEMGAMAGAMMGKGTYKENLPKARQMMARPEQENPKMFGLGDFIGMASSAPAMTNPVSAAALGASEGITRSLGGADKIDQAALAQAGRSGVMDGVTAGTLSKYGPAAFQALGKVGKPASDFFSGIAGRQAVAALKPTQGMIKDLEKTPGLRERVGNFALDEGIVNMFRSQKGMDKKADAVTQGYANLTKPIYEKTKNSTLSKDELLALVGKRAKELKGEPGQQKVAKKFGKYADDIEGAAEEGLEKYSPSALRSFRQAVTEGTKFPVKPNSVQAGNEMRKLLREAEMGQIGKVDPKLRADNEKLFDKIRLGNEVEKIAERGSAQSGANNLFGLNAGIMGTGASAATLAATGDSGAALIAGASVAVAREIARRYGNQWTAKGARGLSNLVSSQKWAPLFEAASKRGGTAVPYLHEKLLKEDPEYRQTFNSIYEDGTK